MPEGETLTWTVRLWRRDPAKLLGVLIGSMVGAAMGVILLNGPVGAIIGFLAVSISTADYWMPLRYTVNGTGAQVRCGISVTAIDWDSVKRVIESEEGVKLSPLERSSRTSPFRGVFLRFADNREDVLNAIRQHWEGDVRPLEG